MKRRTSGFSRSSERNEKGISTLVGVGNETKGLSLGFSRSSERNETEEVLFSLLGVNVKQTAFLDFSRSRERNERVLI